MIVFTVLLGIASAILWFLPGFRRSSSPNVIAGKTSAVGCFGLILFLGAGGVAVSAFRPPAILILLFLIAFLFVPLIALLFSSYLAIRISKPEEGKKPAIRAALSFLILALIGSSLWIGERAFEMRTSRECWKTQLGSKTGKVRSVVLELRKLNPIFSKYSGTLVCVDAEGRRKTVRLPESFDGTNPVNLYMLPEIPGVHPELLLFADHLSILAFQPQTQKFHSLKRQSGKVYLDILDVTGWNLFDRLRYLGRWSDGRFYSPDQQKELPFL